MGMDNAAYWRYIERTVQNLGHLGTKSDNDNISFKKREQYQISCMVEGKLLYPLKFLKSSSSSRLTSWIPWKTEIESAEPDVRKEIETNCSSYKQCLATMNSWKKDWSHQYDEVRHGELPMWSSAQIMMIWCYFCNKKRIYSQNSSTLNHTQIKMIKIKSSMRNQIIGFLMEYLSSNNERITGIGAVCLIMEISHLLTDSKEVLNKKFMASVDNAGGKAVMNIM